MMGTMIVRNKGLIVGKNIEYLKFKSNSTQINI